MKKSIITALTATSLLFGSITAASTDVQAAAKTATVNTDTAAKKATCKRYGACKSLNVYVFKAQRPYHLQDLTYYDAYEPHLKSRLKVGSYYRVVYSDDMPIKAYIMTPTKAQKKALDKRYMRIKVDQKAAGKALQMSYTYGVQY